MHSRFDSEDLQILAHNPPCWHSVMYPWSLGVYHRPALGVYYALMQMAFGRSPFAFHIAGLVAHVATIVALGRLCATLTRSKWLGILCATLFAVYPADTLAITRINANAEVFCTLFMLLTLIAWIEWRTNGRWAALMLCCLSTVAALAFKEDAYPLPLIIVALDLIIAGRPNRKWIVAPITIGVIAWLLNPHVQDFLHGRHSSMIAAYPHGWLGIVERLNNVYRFDNTLTLGVLPFCDESTRVLVFIAIMGFLWAIRGNRVALWAFGCTVCMSVMVPLAVPFLMGFSWYYYPGAAFLCLFAASAPLSVKMPNLADAKLRGAALICLGATLYALSTINPLAVPSVAALCIVVALLLGRAWWAAPWIGIAIMQWLG